MKKRLKLILCRMGIHDYRTIQISTLWASRVFIESCINCGQEKRKK